MFDKIKLELNRITGKEIFSVDMTEAEVHDKLTDLASFSEDQQEQLDTIQDLNSRVEELENAKSITSEDVQKMIDSSIKKSDKSEEIEKLSLVVSEMKANKAISENPEVTGSDKTVYEKKEMDKDLGDFAERMAKAESTAKEMRQKIKDNK